MGHPNVLKACSGYPGIPPSRLRATILPSCARGSLQAGAGSCGLGRHTMRQLFLVGCGFGRARAAGHRRKGKRGEELRLRLHGGCPGKRARPAGISASARDRRPQRGHLPPASPSTATATTPAPSAGGADAGLLQQRWEEEQVVACASCTALDTSQSICTSEQAPVAEQRANRRQAFPQPGPHLLRPLLGSVQPHKQRIKVERVRQDEVPDLASPAGAEAQLKHENKHAQAKTTPVQCENEAQPPLPNGSV